MTNEAREPVQNSLKRQPFNCRISPESALFMRTLPGSNGDKVDYLVTTVRAIGNVLPRAAKV